MSPMPAVGRPPAPDDFLLYPIRKAGRGSCKEFGQPKKRPSSQYVHRWWYARLRDAGIVSEGTTRGLNMHSARHSFAVEMRRAAGVEAASQALGHADISTTLGIYGHQDQGDLERAFEALMQKRRREEPS